MRLAGGRADAGARHPVRHGARQPDKKKKAAREVTFPAAGGLPVNNRKEPYNNIVNLDDDVEARDFIDPTFELDLS